MEKLTRPLASIQLRMPCYSWTVLLQLQGVGIFGYKEEEMNKTSVTSKRNNC